MEYGFSVPNRGPLATPENMVAVAQRGEELGFSIIGVSDHIVIPRAIDSSYPYSETGEFAGDSSGDYLEQLATVGFLVGHTSTARLLTSVMVLPHRSPVFSAKMLATLDVLSKGRLLVGCGVGWMREEFEAIGAPPYDERGAVGDEYIRAFKELWTNEDPRFEGKYCRFDNISFGPKPVQKPHPPIWVGGESPSALRRAALLGDTWYPIGSNPRFPVATAAQLSEYLSRLRRYAETGGRDPSEIGVAYSMGWYDDRQAQFAPDGQRRPFTGIPEQVAGDIREFEGLGVHSLMLRFPGGTLEGTLEVMERFATKVKPLAAR